MRVECHSLGHSLARLLLTAAMLTAVLALGPQPPAARAVEFLTVNDYTDNPASTANDCRILGGICTLRAAILAANEGPQSFITLPPGTLTLTQTQSITLTSAVIFIGDVGTPTIVDRAGTPGQDFIIAGAEVTILRVSFTNSAGGRFGLWVREGANVRLNQSSLSDNGGIGLFVDGAAVTLDQSLVANNAGGGLVLGGANPTAVLTNTTISGNSNGPGVAVNFGQARLTNVTLTDNTALAGGGITVQTGASALVQNTLIAGNEASGGGGQHDCVGALTSLGRNVLGVAAGCSGLTQGVNNDQVGVAPQLGGLAMNGGWTATHALLTGSVGVDAATACPLTDQRGVGRLQGLACDIGAYEVPVVRYAAQAFTVADTASQAVVTATLDANVPFPLGVNYATANGTARAGVDYVAVSGVMTFTSGAPVTFTVPITGHPLYTGDRTLNLALAGPAGVGIGLPASATLTIQDTQAPPAAQFTAGAAEVLKSAGQVTVTVQLSTPSGITATVGYATAAGTAQPSVDYTAVSGTLQFGPGLTSQTIAIPILDDNFYRGDKAFAVALSQPGSATLGAPASVQVKIVDDNPRQVFMPIMFAGPRFYTGACETEPNNITTLANGPLAPNQAYCGAHQGVNVIDSDYFYFDARAGAITVTVANAVSGAQLQLFYESTSNFVGYSAGPNFVINYTGPAGRYYVRLVTPGNYSGGVYSLSVNYPN